MILHWAYDFLPILPVKLISGINESFFQHIKMTFFAYLFVNLVEYFLRRKNIQDKESFIYTRILTTTFLPWVVFIVWYIAPAYYGPFSNVAIEILYANIALIISGFVILVIEHTIDGIAYQKLSKFVLLALFLISMSYYIIFTFRLPWADVFADPTTFINYPPSV